MFSLHKRVRCRIFWALQLCDAASLSVAVETIFTKASTPAVCSAGRSDAWTVAGGFGTRTAYARVVYFVVGALRLRNSVLWTCRSQYQVPHQCNQKKLPHGRNL
uniref:Putative secreted protein n=1 Tax=Ixodes ricinus TaxID=34613 RepID=A0A6B0UFR6_IXORI